MAVSSGNTTTRTSRAISALGLQSAKGGDTHLVGMPKRVFLYVAIYDDGFSPCAKLENTMVLGALRTER